MPQGTHLLTGLCVVMLCYVMAAAMAAALARRDAVLWCCANQERIRVSAVPMVL